MFPSPSWEREGRVAPTVPRTALQSCVGTVLARLAASSPSRSGDAEGCGVDHVLPSSFPRSTRSRTAVDASLARSTLRWTRFPRLRAPALALLCLVLAVRFPAALGQDETCLYDVDNWAGNTTLATAIANYYEVRPPGGVGPKSPCAVNGSSIPFARRPCLPTVPTRVVLRCAF